MEDHSQAYWAWKKAGVHGAWCWHVDAHLDLGQDGLTSAVLDELRLASAPRPELQGNAYLPWGGLHCGNYLLPAIREGMVSRLTWVIPPWLAEGRLLSWAREHLLGWLDLTLSEWAALHESEGVVRGTLVGIPFEVGTAERLRLPEELVLLDVDLDYWVTEAGEVWQDPAELRLPPSLLTTVAYSVRGGYLPDGCRSLGERFFPAGTEGLTATALDRAAALVRQHRHAEAIPALRELEPSVEATYLRGTSHHHLGQSEEALACWKWLSRQELPVDGRAYVGGLCAETLCALGRPEEAREYALQSQRLAPDDYRYFWALAQAQEQCDDLREATRTLRRGLALAEPYVFGLQMRLALARLYRRQDKGGLARIELERLERADVTGELRPLTLLR